ncbi:MAG: LLM class flavin-dependent oxidoreductase [Chloroflexi bacterium]|nr:LLM class flavin-dependent oxidoreductase [Chloroflexota bacterium]
MHFGCYVNPQTPGPEHDYIITRDALRECELAEELGFSGVWLTEHHFTDYNSYADPVVLSAALSQRLRRVRIGYSIAILPLHHPIRFAIQTALVDNLCEGRLIVGIAPGNGPLEFEGFGVPLNERNEMTEEAIDLLLAAWTAGPDGFEHHGRYYHARAARIIPRPFQQPHPLLIRAVVSQASTERWARRGFPAFLGRYTHGEPRRWLTFYRQVMEAAGHPEHIIARAMHWTGILKFLFLAETDDQAIEESRPHIEVYLAKSALANAGDFKLPDDISEEEIDSWMGNAAIIGSPKTVCERIQPYWEAGMQHMLVWPRFGHMPHHQVLRTMRLFMEQVAPEFASQPVGVR